MSKKPFSSAILNAIFENFWLKLIALVFALGFYAFIHSEQDAQRTIAVKLVVESPPENVRRFFIAGASLAPRDIAWIAVASRRRRVRHDGWREGCRSGSKKKPCPPCGRHGFEFFERLRVPVPISRVDDARRGPRHRAGRSHRARESHPQG